MLTEVVAWCSMICQQIVSLLQLIENTWTAVAFLRVSVCVLYNTFPSCLQLLLCSWDIILHTFVRLACLCFVVFSNYVTLRTFQRMWLFILLSGQLVFIVQLQCMFWCQLWNTCRSIDHSCLNGLSPRHDIACLCLNPDRSTTQLPLTEQICQPCVRNGIWSNLLPAGCLGNLPVLNWLIASVAKNQHFRPCRKNYALDRKMIPPFRIVTMFCIGMRSFGEIELRAPAVGTKIVFFNVTLGLPAREGHT